MMVLAIIGLIILGILLLFLELFVVPGITVAGIGGAILLVSGIVMSFSEYGNTVGIISIVVTTVATALGLVLAFKSNTWKGLSLDKAIDSKVGTLEVDEVMAGDRGRAISRIAPMGKVLINDHYYEAKSLGDFITEQSDIEVIKVFKGQIIVKPLNNQ